MNKHDDQTPKRTFSHYGFFQFTQFYWQQEEYPRRSFLEEVTESISEKLLGQTYFYSIFPARPEADLMIWNSFIVENSKDVGEFFSQAASQTSRWRQFLKPVETLWGFTRPSVYASGKSSQELDPFQNQRRPYLVVYPFVKTSEWYLMSKESRQEMMNEHIRVGRQYPQITQLLLYSTGLQDQEFVVVYETDDLALFSNLVTALRSTEGRKYTLRDTPIYTSIHQTPEQIITDWS